jgi:hypothetical protein
VFARFHCGSAPGERGGRMVGSAATSRFAVAGEPFEASSMSLGGPALAGLA